MYSEYASGREFLILRSSIEEKEKNESDSQIGQIVGREKAEILGGRLQRTVLVPRGTNFTKTSTHDTYM